MTQSSKTITGLNVEKRDVCITAGTMTKTDEVVIEHKHIDVQFDPQTGHEKNAGDQITVYFDEPIIGSPWVNVYDQNNHLHCFPKVEATAIGPKEVRLDLTVLFASPAKRDISGAIIFVRIFALTQAQ